MFSFTLAAAQVPSVRGDVAANVATHVRTIQAAATHEVAVLIFPELSLTGYEPELAAALALAPCDAILEPLRRAAAQDDGRGRCTLTPPNEARTGCDHR